FDPSTVQKAIRQRGCRLRARRRPLGPRGRSKATRPSPPSGGEKSCANQKAIDFQVQTAFYPLRATWPNESQRCQRGGVLREPRSTCRRAGPVLRSEEHTSEL